MAFRLKGGGVDGGDYLSGTWITSVGETTPLNDDTLDVAPLATSTVAGRQISTRWRLQALAQGLDLIVEAPHANRWMATTVSYWEGEVIA